MAEPLLQLRGIRKSFAGVQALRGVDFTVRAGEIHALLGENGAGKSTLIKVLTGVHFRDEGDILWQGRPVDPRSPRDAEALGISTVYQEVNLIPDLSVEENILLGRQPRRFGLIDWKALRVRARAALARIGLDLDPAQPLSALPLALRQMVAIARALDLNARLLVLDEPTSSLDEREVESLFAVMRRLRGEGLGLVFVTHFLDQVYAVSDTITVLRNGEGAGESPAAELPRRALVARMLGREGDSSTGTANAPADQDGEIVLSARGIARAGAVGPLDLDLRRGEVTGLAGLLGSGRTETARLLFGADRAQQGRVTVDGHPLAAGSPAAAMAAGLAFCSEDRKAEGILPNLSVRENLVLALQSRRGVLRLLPRAEQERLANHYIEALRIRTPSPETPIRNLSGGNQQKVLLARWLCLQPRVLILDEPTRGIDIGAKEEIARLVERLRGEGVAVLFISSELEEVVRASQRVIVLRDRLRVAELRGADITEAALMERMAGHG